MARTTHDLNYVLNSLNENNQQITDLIENKLVTNESIVVKYDDPTIGVKNRLNMGIVRRIFKDADGKYLIIFNLYGFKRIYRFNSNWTLDTSFNLDASITSFDFEFISQQSSGKYILCGYNIAGPSVARINNDGSVDNTFDNSTIYSGDINKTIILQDDSILICGSVSSVNSILHYGLAKLNADGTLNTSFSTNCNAVFAGKGFSHIYRMDVASDGKIFVSNKNNSRIFKLNADGTSDDTFNINGNFPIRFWGKYNAIVYDIKVDANGKLLLAGDFSYYGLYPTYTNRIACSTVVRLNTDGTVDNTFNLGDTNLFPKTVEDYAFCTTGTVYSINIQPDNKILIGGNFIKLNGQYQRCLVRLNEDGTKDETFDINEGFRINSVIYDTILDGNKIYAVGYFDSYNNIITNAPIVKLSNTGELEENPGFSYPILKTIGLGAKNNYEIYFNTNLTNLYENMSNDYDTYIRNTHTTILANYRLNIENEIYTNDGGCSIPDAQGVINYNFTPDGQIENSSEYFGENSSYFTNYYEGMFVLCASDININEFSVVGWNNHCEDGIETTQLTLKNNTYSCFIKTRKEIYEDQSCIDYSSIIGNSCQIILVPGTLQNITHIYSEDGQGSEDNLVSGINNRNHLYYLFFNSTSNITLEKAQEVAEKFLEIVVEKEPLTEYDIKLTPELINMSTEGSQDSSVVNGVSQQRKINMLTTRRYDKYKTIIQTADGKVINNQPESIADYPNIKLN